MTQHATMHIDLRVGECLTLNGGAITVRLEAKSGQRARLAVIADKSITVTPPGRKPSNQSSAQECASSPAAAKEHTHGKHPL